MKMTATIMRADAVGRSERQLSAAKAAERSGADPRRARAPDRRALEPTVPWASQR